MDDDVKELIERCGKSMCDKNAGCSPKACVCSALEDALSALTRLSKANAQLKQDIADIAQYKPQEIDAELAAKDARIEELEGAHKKIIELANRYPSWGTIQTVADLARQALSEGET